MKVTKVKENGSIYVVMDFMGVEKPSAARVISSLLKDTKRGFENIVFAKDTGSYKGTDEWFTEFYISERKEDYLEFLLAMEGA
jgi:hypothetical protein